MEFEVHYAAGQSGPTVSTLVEPNLEALDAAASRLRSWAVIRGASITGGPFVRLHPDRSAVLHLPTMGRVRPHPETGVIPGERQEGLASGSVDGVNWQDVPVVAEGLSAALAAWGPRSAAEFHAGENGFTSGRIILFLVREPDEATRPASITVELRAPAPGEASAATEPRVPLVPKTILVALDGSRGAENALPTALALATHFDAALQLLTVVAPGEASAAGGFENAQTQYEAYQRKLAQVTGFASVSPAVVEGDPATVILERASEADLLVIASHGRGGVHALLVGSVADKVVRGSNTPVLVAPASGPALAPRGRPVLIALDGSPDAELGLAVARDLGGAYGGELVLVRAVTPPAMAYASEFAYVTADAFESLEEAAREYLARIRHEGESVHVVPGPAAAAILDLAEVLDVDLVVVTSSGKGLAARFALGSVTDRLMHSLRRPLLVVPNR